MQKRAPNNFEVTDQFLHSTEMKCIILFLDLMKSKMRASKLVSNTYLMMIIIFYYYIYFLHVDDIGEIDLCMSFKDYWCVQFLCMDGVINTRMA